MPPQRKGGRRGDTAPERAVRRPMAAHELARRTPKTSEVVALEIVRDIVSQGLKPGDRLPLEAEMLVQYRVSRSSLREALRLLEVQGLIAIRPGPGAGTVVGRVHPGHVARSLTLHLHMLGANYDHVLDAWLACEPLLARLAAHNPDRELVRNALTPFLEESHRQGPEFHDTVGGLAANPVLSLVLRSIGCIVAEQVIPRGELEPPAVHDHRELAGAIVDGDAERSERLMREHLMHIVERFKADWPMKTGEKIQWR